MTVKNNRKIIEDVMALPLKVIKMYHQLSILQLNFTCHAPLHLNLLHVSGRKLSVESTTVWSKLLREIIRAQISFKLFQIIIGIFMKFLIFLQTHATELTV